MSRRNPDRHDPVTGRPWTLAEVEILDSEVPEYGLMAAVEQLREEGFDRSPAAVFEKACQRGLLRRDGGAA